MPFDPELNLQRIADQVRVLQTKAERQRKWADWARGLITQHAHTIHRLEEEKASLLAALAPFTAPSLTISEGLPDNKLMSFTVGEVRLARVAAAKAEEVGS